MSPAVIRATDKLRDFLFEKVYNRLSAEAETEQAREIVRRLYLYFGAHGDELPQEYSLHGEGVARRVVDYIAGMTDQYATTLASELRLIEAQTR